LRSLQGTDGYVLRDLQVVCGTMGLPTATVKLECPNGTTAVMSHVGIGPIDAAYKAIDSIVDVHVTLEDYSVTSVTSGIDSVATTRVCFSIGSSVLS
jgi:2-isopropylmalate synthase